MSCPEGWLTDSEEGKWDTVVDADGKSSFVWKWGCNCKCAKDTPEKRCSKKCDGVGCPEGYLAKVEDCQCKCAVDPDPEGARRRKEIAEAAKAAEEAKNQVWNWDAWNVSKHQYDSATAVDKLLCMRG